MSDLFTAENAIALLTLTSLEVVLGIDNVVFIAILSARLPPEQQGRGRRIGLALAMVSRIVLLLCITWIMKLTAPVLNVLSHDFSGRDLILLVGGVFLIGKATFEIHDKLEGGSDHAKARSAGRSFTAVVMQIAVLDIIFSLDSVITAVGMVQHVGIMVVAVVLAVIVMMVFAGPVSAFVQRHPTIKMLALSFLLLVGVMLVAEGLGRHIEKGYLYFAMAFSLLVELLNLRVLKKNAHPPAAAAE